MKICHISDLHIRAGDLKSSRFDEYSAVFQRLARYVAVRAKEEETIAIITGDIFHHKLRIESCGIQLFFDLMRALSDIVPVFILRGNHDYRQDKPDDPDMITPLLGALTETKNPITYFNETGHYTYGDIGFGVVAVQDTLDWGNSASQVVENLPPFPDPQGFDENDTIKHRVALFHGTIARTHMPSGQTAPTGYPMEWFKGYDAVMLGDIHLQSIYKTREGMPWGYPGSLIQQDHGEHLYGHGVIMWSLDSSQVQAVQAVQAVPVHITNPYGFITLRTADQHIMFRTQREKRWTPLQDVINESWFPKKLRVRCIEEHADPYAVFAPYAAAPYGIEIVDVSTSAFAASEAEAEGGTDGSENRTQGQNSENDTDNVLQSCNTPETWISYISNTHNIPNEDMWTAWIRDPTTHLMVPDIHEIKTKIATRNDKIRAHIDKYTDRVSHVNHRFGITTISWSYILCYAADSHVNFRSLDRRVNCIIGKNGEGKTSFMETICIGLFGAGFPSRLNKAYSGCLVNKHKPPAAVAFTSITVTLGNNETFTIYRTFDSTPDQKVKVGMCHVSESQTQTQIRKGASATNAWVQQNIGNIDSFLMGCMVTQNQDQDFFNLKTTEQQELLDKSLDIDSSSLFSAALKESRLAHSFITDLLDTLNSTYKEEVSRAFNEHQGLLEDEPVLAQLEGELGEKREHLGTAPNTGARIKPYLNYERAALQAMLAGLDNETMSVSHYHDLTSKVDKLFVHSNNTFQMSQVPQVPLAEAKRQYGVLMAKRPPEPPQVPKDYIAPVNISQTVTSGECKSESESAQEFQNSDLIEHLSHPPQTYVPSAFTSTLLSSVKSSAHNENENENAIHTVERAREVESLLKEVADITKQKNTYVKQLSEAKTHPYNPECEACRQQPWRVHHQNLEERVREQDQELTVRMKALQTQSTDTTMVSVKCALARFIASQTHNMATWRLKRDLIIATLRSDYEQYMTQERAIKRLIGEVHAYEQVKLKHEIDAIDKERTISEAIENIDAYRTYNERLSTIQALEKRQKIAAAEVTIKQKRKDDHVMWQDKLAQMQELLRQLRDKVRTMDQVGEAFAGFKTWLYQEKVMPLLERHTNSCVQMLTAQHRPIGLSAQFQGNQFHWLLKDNGTLLPLEKASGFQRFVVSLAMRICLGKLGVSGIRCKQLFIDEGFTACDQDNLSCVPQFLQDLLAWYDSILIVSHLDELKTSFSSYLKISEGKLVAS